MTESVLMQAIRYHQYGGPEQLVLEQVPRPETSPGMVLVRVCAAGVNPIDWKIRSNYLGRYQAAQLPAIPGFDLAGVIEAVGPDVTGLERGQAVYGTGSGSYAQYALAPAHSLAPKPAALTFDEAASVPIGAQTAWRALFDQAGLQAGQRLLVQGAAGGVGLFAVQFARWKGAHVIGTASAANQDFIRSLGVEMAIDYQATHFEEVVRDVDVVLDTVGGEVQERSWQVLRPGGFFVSVVGQLSPDKAQAYGVRLPAAGRPDPARAGVVLREVAALIESRQVRAQVRQVLPLVEASRAHALCQMGHGRGHLVLHVADL
jgi:NADPH:quinone reductase-like Zn-dependent oxidoreductase